MYFFLIASNAEALKALQMGLFFPFGCPSLQVLALFKNTNVEEVLNRQKQKRVQAREDAQKKKEMDKMQREKDKLSKQERKEKEKKRTQKGERKR